MNCPKQSQSTRGGEKWKQWSVTVPSSTVYQKRLGESCKAKQWAPDINSLPSYLKPSSEVNRLSVVLIGSALEILICDFELRNVLEFLPGLRMRYRTSKINKKELFKGVNFYNVTLVTLEHLLATYLWKVKISTTMHYKLIRYIYRNCIFHNEI